MKCPLSVHSGGRTSRRDDGADLSRSPGRILWCGPKGRRGWCYLSPDPSVGGGLSSGIPRAGHMALMSIWAVRWVHGRSTQRQPRLFYKIKESVFCRRGTRALTMTWRRMVSSFPRSLWAISEYWCQIDSLEQLVILEGDILSPLRGPNPKGGEQS